ncbi:hypothetical protein QZH41_017890 [Actinostola sp. cb2023]|nr:hypothetical protein QZH41_017890 [Actinostola sp. cb2023]
MLLTKLDSPLWHGQQRTGRKQLSAFYCKMEEMQPFAVQVERVHLHSVHVKVSWI